jgi:DNA-binding transcriptional MerR regulator
MKALRLYEERGLINPNRTAAGWREYGPDALARAAEIVALRALGFSLSQVGRVLNGVADGLEPALAAHQVRLEADLRRLEKQLEKVSGLRRQLLRGDIPATDDLVGLVHPPSDPIAAFELPWPWGGELFELRDVRSLNYIVGPLGSGKTRLAKMLADQIPDAVFLGLERGRDQATAAKNTLALDARLRERVQKTLSWLAEDGAAESDTLTGLIVGLEQFASKTLVIDLIEQGFDEATQQAVMALLRKRGPDECPLFVMTRSSAILDLSATTPNEVAIFCPANHSAPIVVDLVPGARGFEALSSCLGSPEVRARTDGMIAYLPRTAAK